MSHSAVDVLAVTATLPVLKNRTPETSGDAASAAFAIIAETEDGAVFAGSFEGQSAWERHGNGDELVQVLKGQTRLTILTEDGPEFLDMKAGMVTIVPRGCWHQFDAPNGVTVMTMTPQPTDHTTDDLLAEQVNKRGAA